MKKLYAAREIRGKVVCPPNHDLLPLCATATAVTGCRITAGPIESTAHVERIRALFSALATSSVDSGRISFSPREDSQEMLFDSTSLYCRDFIVFALLASGRRLRFEKLSETRTARWTELARRSRCVLEITRNDTGVSLSVTSAADSGAPDSAIAPDELHAFLGVCFGLRRPFAATVDFQPASPLRHLLPLLGFAFDVRSAAQRPSDPVARRILRMKGKPLTSQGASSFTISIDFRAAATPEISVDLPGDDTYAALMFAAKALVQKGNLIVENVCLEPWASVMLPILRRMGCNPAIQPTHECSFGQCGMVQLQRFDCAGRKVECTPLFQYEMAIPAIVAVSMFAEGESVIRCLEQLREDIPDSVEELNELLRTMNAHNGEMPDGLVVKGTTQYDGFDIEQPLRSQTAAAWAICALKCIGASSLDDSSIAERWPRFFEVLDNVCEYRAHAGSES